MISTEHARSANRHKSVKQTKKKKHISTLKRIVALKILVYTVKVFKIKTPFRTMKNFIT